MSNNTDDNSGLEAIRRSRNARPSDKDFAQIGRIALNHSGLEFQLESLTWIYMGDVDVGHVATSQMTTLQIIEALKTMVEWTEPDDSVAAEIDWCIQAFNVLRVNRNTVIHGFNFKADRDNGKLFIERRTRSVVFDSFEQFEFDSATLMRLIADQDSLADHLYHIQFHVDARSVKSLTPNPNAPSNPATIRPRPESPIPLKPLDREKPQSDRRRRRFSLEKVAQEERYRARSRKKSQKSKPTE